MPIRILMGRWYHLETDSQTIVFEYVLKDPTSASFLSSVYRSMGKHRDPRNQNERIRLCLETKKNSHRH
jgi:hypothetical protein